MRSQVLIGALAVGLLAPGLIVPTTARAAELPEPIAHYQFDATGPGKTVPGETVADSSGNHFDATLVNPGSAVVVEDGRNGSALSLPGGAPDSSGAYVKLPRSVLAGTSDLTVSIRVKWDGVTTPWQWIYALGKDNGRYLFTTPYNGGGILRTAITTGGGGAEAQVDGSAALPAQAWKTITVTLDTSADRITSYLDGVSFASATSTVGGSDLIDDATTFAGYIGKSFYADPLFDGAIDDFRIYGSALSAAQVAEIYGDELPVPVQLAQSSFDVRTPIATAPKLPATVRATFSDNFDRAVPIQWTPIDPARYATIGSFTVTGTADGQPVTAKVTVIHDGQTIVDLAQKTGPFHGGAAGSLYGLYGPGVPSNNLIEGMHLRTVATKAQDGPQHPGADALEVVQPLADSTDGDVYVYMTDIHRGFPYQWPGDTPAQKLALYQQKIGVQVDQVLKLDPKYQDNIVFVPFNEPEGNMFGTGEWSYNKVSWLSDPADYFAAWDDTYALIKKKMPAARIAGPNTSVLYPQVRGFLEHAVQAGTVPDVMTWHELSHPEAVRTSVATYRGWEKEVFAGTAYAGRKLPINVNEYAFNYHTSVPGQMIQWVSAIEESKIDADIAYWNIDGNISDSAVQANRGNGQWWLFNSYGNMSGQTVAVSPPYPGQNYTLKGVATLDEDKAQARMLLGGASGKAWVQFDHVPAAVFGKKVRATVREIPWTGQIGDSARPELVAQRDLVVTKGSVVLDFGDALPKIDESAAYEIVLTPAVGPAATPVPEKLWKASYEAEDATYQGSGYSKNGPEGSPSDVSKFYTSGGYDVGGLRTGSDGVLNFTVDVPRSGRYDLSVFANSLNTFDLVKAQGPTNVFLRVDGDAEQELFLPLGYKWVVWDHSDTTVDLTAGRHVISLAARSLDGSRTTKGDAIVDRIQLSRPNPAASTATYQAELAELDGARPVYAGRGAGAKISKTGRATFWVYSAGDTESTIRVRTIDGGRARLAVNGHDLLDLGHSTSTVTAALSGGINKVTVTGLSKAVTVDRIEVTPAPGKLRTVGYEAENAELGGSAAVSSRSRASGQAAVSGIGGTPGNDNTLTFTVTADRAGQYAMRIRYANPEQAEATHYNPDPLARPADISVNGGTAERVLFPHSFHENNFWELTIPLQLRRGLNTIKFSSTELPNFDGTTYASQTFPGILLRSQYAPVIDKIALTPLSGR